jgi:hypothetical protein
MARNVPGVTRAPYRSRGFEASPPETLGRLGGEHGRAVVSQKGVGQTAFLERLRHAVDESFGRLVDPPGQLAVVSGATQVKSLAMGAGPSPPSRSRIETGARRRSGAGPRRADRSTKGAVDVNGPRHHPSHRRVVRAGTPVVQTPALTVAAATATALTSTTIAPMYTRRPRNRTDGGVARWRHPSRPQHRLKRRPIASAAIASSPPRACGGSRHDKAAPAIAARLLGGAGHDRRVDRRQSLKKLSLARLGRSSRLLLVWQPEASPSEGL